MIAGRISAGARRSVILTGPGERSSPGTSGVTTTPMSGIRNIAIIAHVDHGKTTLVDCLLKQSGTFRANEAFSGAERIMDSNDLERERGCDPRRRTPRSTSPASKSEHRGYAGHSDFWRRSRAGLEDGGCGCFSSWRADGPMPQTRFVLRKAFELGPQPIVVVNRSTVPRRARTRSSTRSSILMVDLGATDEQLDFPIVHLGQARLRAPRGRSHGDRRPPAPRYHPRRGARADGRSERPAQMLAALSITTIISAGFVIGRVVKAWHDPDRAGRTICKLDGSMVKSKVAMLMALKECGVGHHRRPPRARSSSSPASKR